MAGHDPTDGELLHALRRDALAAGVLYDRYALRLVRYLQQQGADEQTAFDAVQETFARLVVYRRHVEPGADGTIRPWLAVVGRNLVRDWQRRGVVETKARERLGLPLTADESSEALSRVEASQLSPQLRLAFARLPREQQAAVAARVVDELDYRQIAAVTGTSEQTIRGRVSRGLRAMHIFLQGGAP